MSKRDELIKIKKMLAKALFNFAEYVTTDEKILIVDDMMEVGVNAYIYDENGEKVTAPDGDYNIDDMGLVVVSGGVITEIKKEEVTEEAKVEETKVETTEVEQSKEEVEVKSDEKFESVKLELASLVSKYDNLIKIVDEMFKQVEEFAKKPVQTEEEKKEVENVIKTDSKASKYFKK